MRSLFSNLNVRLIIIHLVGFWFFFYAFQSLGFLHDRVFFNPMFERVNRINFPDRYNLDIVFIQQAGNIGLLFAYVISWFVASKRNWHWLNDVIVFLIAFAFGNVKVGGSYWFGWDHLSPIFLAPGNLFPKNSVASYITDGVIMIALGLVILLLNKLKDFIDNGDPNYKRKVVADKKARRIK